MRGKSRRVSHRSTTTAGWRQHPGDRWRRREGVGEEDGVAFFELAWHAGVGDKARQQPSLLLRERNRRARRHAFEQRSIVLPGDQTGHCASGSATRCHLSHSHTKFSPQAFSRSVGKLSRPQSGFLCRRASKELDGAFRALPGDLSTTTSS